MSDLSGGTRKENKPMSEAGWGEYVHVTVFEFVRGRLFFLHSSHIQFGRLEVDGVFGRELHLRLDAVQGRGLLEPEVRLQTESSCEQTCSEETIRKTKYIKPDVNMPAVPFTQEVIISTRVQPIVHADSLAGCFSPEVFESEPGSVGDFCTVGRFSKRLHRSSPRPPPSFPPMKMSGLISAAARCGGGQVKGDPTINKTKHSYRSSSSST